MSLVFASDGTVIPQRTSTRRGKTAFEDGGDASPFPLGVGESPLDTRRYTMLY